MISMVLLLEIVEQISIEEILFVNMSVSDVDAKTLFTQLSYPLL